MCGKLSMAFIMNKHSIAQTDVTLSALTLGTVKFGRNQSVKYPSSFNLPSDVAISDLLVIASDNGITTLDTAPAYGISEERIGNLLKNRQHWQIITKAGETYDPKTDNSTYDFSVKTLEKSLENSLKKLKTDYLDCWMLHSDGNDIANLNDDVIQLFIRAKERGLVRSIGASTKTVAGGCHALQYFDCIMMTISLNNTSEKALLDIAQEKHKSLIIKKIYDSGWALTANDSPEEKQGIMQTTLKNIFQHSAVCSAIVGTINPTHLKENIAAFHAMSNEI